MTGRKAGITTLLLKEINNNGKTPSFVYDAVGNITTISENGVQKVKYTYNALSELTVWILHGKIRVLRIPTMPE